ncbi:MAG: Zn-ribbon domain-containing OB-fold protein [Candidatus Baldrarchaeia archaeon]
MTNKQEPNKYSYVMDIFPQEHKEETRLWKFFENLKQGKLTTTRCKKCGHIFWPPEVICPKCLSDELEYVELPKRGKIYAFTIHLGAIPPGFKPPLIDAIIDFENGIRIISQLVDTKLEDIKVGDEVELKVIDIPPDSHGDRVLFFFKKV